MANRRAPSNKSTSKKAAHIIKGLKPVSRQLRSTKVPVEREESPTSTHENARDDDRGDVDEDDPTRADDNVEDSLTRTNNNVGDNGLAVDSGGPPHDTAVS
jgi:hypothetical protein